MRTIIITILLAQVICLNAQSSTADNVQIFTADNAQSKVNWKGYGEVGGFVQTGTIGLKSVIINYSGTTMNGEIIMDMSTISHQDKQLEKHLKAKDFFNVKKYPTSRFTIQSYEGKSINGMMHINGHTHNVSFDIDINQVDEILVVKGCATIDRTLFDIKYNSSSYFQDLGNYAIKNEFDLDFEVIFTRE